MKIYDTATLDASKLSPLENHVLYNGLDALMTMEIFDQTKPRLDKDTSELVYRYERLSLGPIMTMMNRGIRIDQQKAETKAREIEFQIRALYGIEMQGVKAKRKAVLINPDAQIQRIARACGHDLLNINSPKQLQTFFFETLNIPKIIKYDKGERKVSTDRKALEKIQEHYTIGRYIAALILKIRDYEGELEILSCGLDSEGRWRFSLNVCGTETGRYSSGDHPLRYGRNIQNVAPELRDIFIPDPGYLIAYCDLKGAESRGVAYLSGDQGYIDANESGDVHTRVSSMVYGFEPERDLADREYYNKKSYRDMAKKFGHGSSYLGTPPTLAKQASTPVEFVKEFQKKFFLAFPGIRKWQEEIISLVQSVGEFIGPMGWRRKIWGRLNDEAVWRTIIASGPQNLIAHIMGIAQYRFWHKYEPRVQLLANIHDAIVFQIKPEDLHLIPDILKTLEVSVPIRGRVMTIPLDCEVGHNWGKMSTKNPGGLRKFKAEDWK